MADRLSPSWDIGIRSQQHLITCKDAGPASATYTLVEPEQD